MNGTEAYEVVCGTLKHREANAALEWHEKNTLESDAQTSAFAPCVTSWVQK